MSNLHEIAAQMVAPGKGILAIDESHRTCKKRFDAVGVEFSEEKRREYRQLLVTAPGIDESLSGMILFDETLRQKTDDGRAFVDVLSERGILPGIKVDTGSKPLALFPNEEVTEGLDGLRDRLKEYSEIGAKFAKWRAVINIGSDFPTKGGILANCHALARYAGLCQEAGLVPMVEPEIMMVGDHSAERCQEVAEQVWTTLFEQLEVMNVDLKGTILKTSMVLSGTTASTQADVAEVARLTVESFKKTIPSELAGIVFLSGGQTSEQATAHLNEINKTKDLPWPVSFSFGRSIQQPCLNHWAENQADGSGAQEKLAYWAKQNSLATKGEL